jgi:hypothetical protein
MAKKRRRRAKPPWPFPEFRKRVRQNDAEARTYLKKGYQKHLARKLFGPSGWPAGRRQRDLFEEAVGNAEADMITAIQGGCVNNWKEFHAAVNTLANQERTERSHRRKLAEGLADLEKPWIADAERKAQREQVKIVEGYLGSMMYADMRFVLRPREQHLMELSYPRGVQRKLDERALARLTKHPRRKLKRVRQRARGKLIAHLERRIGDLPPHIQAALPAIDKDPDRAS